jgi:hypothetical protein
MPDERACHGREYVHTRSNGHGLANFAQWHHATYKSFCSNYGDHSTPARGYRCWNEEAIQTMTEDLSTVWDSFAIDLDVEIEHINTATNQIFARIIRLASSARGNEPRAPNNNGSAMRTFVSNLIHREHLTRYGVDRANETFESKLSSLRTDAFSSVRTAFIGGLMESTYHAANMEFGKFITINSNIT